MTPEEIQNYRDWSARKMGWVHENDLFQDDLSSNPCWRDPSDYSIKIAVFGWHPDKDANQCFMLVERMRELGWAFDLWCHARGNDFCAKFTEDTGVTGNIIRTKENNNNPCLAIIKAARATEEVK